MPRTESSNSVKSHFELFDSAMLDTQGEVLDMLTCCQVQNGCWMRCESICDVIIESMCDTSLELLDSIGDPVCDAYTSNLCDAAVCNT
jgi:hypothetical protein